MRLPQRIRSSYMVCIEQDNSRVTIPDWGADHLVFPFEISFDTVRSWPKWLRGAHVPHEEIVWLEDL